MILDPSDTSNVTFKYKPDQLSDVLPANVKKFGFLPNIKNLRPGDLILTSDDSLVSKAIERCQKGQFGEQAMWTHAAIYIGDHYVIEARPFRGVTWSKVIRYIPNRKILVRRPILLSESQSEERAIIDGLNSALRAAYMASGWVSYGLSTAWEYGILLSGADIVPRYTNGIGQQSGQSFICSTLYEKCISEATGQRLSPNTDISNTKFMTPAFLAVSTKLQTLNVGWAKLPDI